MSLSLWKRGAALALSLACVLSALCASPAKAQTLYENTTEPFFTGAQSPDVLDDVTLANFTPGITLSTLEFGFLSNTTDASTATVTIWDTLDFNADPVVSNPLASFTLNTTTPTTGFYILNPLDISSFNIAPTNEFIGVQISFSSASQEIVFAGGGPTVGASEDVYFEDENGDGVFSPDEGFFFGGGSGNLANFYLSLTGRTTVAAAPEPGTLALLGFGAFAGVIVVRRSRRAS